jgi:hypothetical protein
MHRLKVILEGDRDTEIHHAQRMLIKLILYEDKIVYSKYKIVYQLEIFLNSGWHAQMRNVLEAVTSRMGVKYKTKLYTSVLVDK